MNAIVLLYLASTADAVLDLTQELDRHQKGQIQTRFRQVEVQRVV